MLRRFRLRPPAFLLALLYLALPAQVLGVRGCAHHDGIPQEVVEADAHHADHGAPASDEDAKTSHEECSCIGVCLSAGVALLAAQVRDVAEFSIPVPAPTFHAEPGVRALHPAPFVIPFAHAPPVI